MDVEYPILQHKQNLPTRNGNIYSVPLRICILYCCTTHWLTEPFMFYQYEAMSTGLVWKQARQGLLRLQFDTCVWAKTRQRSSKAISNSSLTIFLKTVLRGVEYKTWLHAAALQGTTSYNCSHSFQTLYKQKSKKPAMLKTPWSPFSA